MIDSTDRRGVGAAAVVDDAALLDAAFVGRSERDEYALFDGARRLSWRTLDTMVVRIANPLLALAVTAGDAVCWQLANQLEAVIIHHAALRIGAMSTPIVAIYRHRAVSFILRQLQAAIVVVPNRFRGIDYPAVIRELRSVPPDLRRVLVLGQAADRSNSFDTLLAAADECTIGRR